MKKLKVFLKNYAWILIWATVSVFVALLIHICFKIDAPNKFWVASWGAGDILTYVSTVALGLLAFYQNQKITQQVEERDNYTFAVEHNALFDFGKIAATYMDERENIKEGKLIDSGFNGNKAVWKYRSLFDMSLLKLEIEIENIGICTATNLRIADSEGKKIHNTNILHDLTGKNDKKYIKNGGSGVAIICLDLQQLREKDNLVYYLTFTNPFGNEYSQKIIVTNTIDSLIQIDAQCTLNINQER